MSEPTHQQLQGIVVDALEELKAKDITCIDIKEVSSIADTMIIASGTSNRQLKALADNVIEQAKQNGFPPVGVEGQDSSEWVLVDLGDLIVHLMLPATREYYDLERLWTDPDQHPDRESRPQDQ